MTCEYDVNSEVECPYCGHSPLHSRYCIEFDCVDGYKEVFFDDIEIEGTGEMVPCEECAGTGVEWWCPKCGENLSGDTELQKQFNLLNEEMEEHP